MILLSPDEQYWAKSSNNYINLNKCLFYTYSYNTINSLINNTNTLLYHFMKLIIKYFK
jgi:hypothetical protein